MLLLLFIKKMNAIKQLPDDLQDMIYFELHKSYTKDIKTKLQKEIDRRWERLDDYEKYEIIQKWFPTEYTEFFIYNVDGKIIDPRLIPYIGFYRIYELYENDNEEPSIYLSKILYNPTYGEILLEYDKFLKHIGYNTHHFLNKINIKYKKNIDTYCISASLTEAEEGFN